MFYILVVVVVMVLILIIKKLIADTRISSKNYIKYDQLVTKPEQILLYRLEKSLPNKYKIGYQVALNRLVKPVAKDRKKYFRLSSKIGSKSVDFVILSQDYVPLLVIELDDSSHSSKQAMARDKLKTNILQASGIPLIRFNVKNIPDMAELNNLFFNNENAFLKVKK